MKVETNASTMFVAYEVEKENLWVLDNEYTNSEEADLRTVEDWHSWDLKDDVKTLINLEETLKRFFDYDDITSLSIVDEIEINMKYAVLTWDEFRDLAMTDAQLWKHAGYDSSCLTVEAIINEYDAPEELFNSDVYYADATTSSFTIEEVAEKTLEYLEELEKEEEAPDIEDEIEF
jgi:hypothetical protein